MSNKTQTQALSIRGQNPQNLIEAIIRNKIYQNRYWKEKLPGLTAATIIDEVLELDYIGGKYGGNRKPSKFLMLALKLLQISPEKAEVLEYINQEEYKYLTALGCFYIRLVALPEDVFKILEPFYANYRKLRFRNLDGSFTVIHMDQYVESLINEEVYLDTLLPHISKRYILEENNVLKPRIIPQLLQQEIENEEEQYQKQLILEDLLKQQQEEEGEIKDKDINRESESIDKKEKKKKHRRRSSSHSNSSAHSRDKKKKSHNHRFWRSVIRGEKIGNNNNKKPRSRSRSSSSKYIKREKQLDKNSVEYWNIERAKLGLPLL